MSAIFINDFGFAFYCEDGEEAINLGDANSYNAVTCIQNNPELIATGATHLLIDWPMSDVMYGA